MSLLRRYLQFLLPIAVLVAGGLIAFLLLTNRPRPIVRSPVKLGPVVRAVVAEARPTRLDVVARGTVEPLRTVELAAEVGGRIVASHPALRAGGAFTPNDVLVEIDATDYRLAIVQQEAAVARAELRLAQERAEAEAALRAWQQLEGDRPPEPLVRREPQIRDAELALAAAQAQLQQSRVDLDRTKVTLPFSGRVRSVHADVGQTVQRGQRLAVVLDTGEFEVRLPIPLDDTAFVDLPLAGGTDDGPDVELRADVAGRRATWSGRIVRTEGEIDRRTRQLTVVARVPARDGNGTGHDVPLLVGMFVEARIVGRTVDDVVLVPRAALAEDRTVWVVRLRIDGLATWTPIPSQRLVRRTVEVLRLDREHAVLSAGIEPGEIVCLSRLEAPVPGMRVRIGELTPANDVARER